MNRQIGVGDFKYVVVSDPLPLGHVIRRMRIHYRPTSIVQQKSVNSVFAYFLTTDKAISMKLDQNIKQVKIYTNFYICAWVNCQRGVVLLSNTGHRLRMRTLIHVFCFKSGQNRCRISGRKYPLYW